MLGQAKVQGGGLLAVEARVEQRTRLDRRTLAVFEQVVREHAQVAEQQVAGQLAQGALDRAQGAEWITQVGAAQPRGLVPVSDGARAEPLEQLRIRLVVLQSLLQLFGQAMPAGQREDGPVEFTIPLTGAVRQK